MMRTLRWILAVVCGVMALLVLGLAVVWLNLPAVAESRLQAMVADLAPDQPFRCTVRRIGLRGADLESIILGSPQDPALVIDSLRLDYSLPRLLARQVDRLAVSGLRVRGSVRNGQFILAGFPPPPEDEEPPKSLTPPLALALLTVSGGLLSCEVEGRWYQLPFFGRVVQENPSGMGDVAAPLAGRFTLFPEGQEVGLTAVAALAEKRLRLSLLAPDLDLQRFPAPAQEVSLAGRMRLEINAALALAPLVMERVALKVALLGLGVTGQGGAWQVSSSGPSLLALDLAAGEGRWRLKSTGLVLGGAVPATVPELEGAGVVNAESLRGSGTLRGLVQPPGQEPFAVQGDFQGRISRQGGWNLSLRAVPAAGPESRYGLRYESLALQVQQPPAAPLRLSADLAGLVLRPGPGQEFSLPLLNLRAQGFEGRKGRGLRAQILIPKGSFHDSGSGLRLDGISGKLPFVWPVAAKGAAGTLTVQEMHFKEQSLGGFSSQVWQQGLGVALIGQHQSRVVEGLVAEVRGHGALSPKNEVQAEVVVTVQPRDFSGVDLGELAGLSQEITLSGRMEMGGGYTFSGGKSAAKAHVTLHNGHLALPGRDIVLKGVDLSLALPELPVLRSLPAQPFSFATGRMGSFTFAKGKFFFQVEPPSSLFIEGGEIAWSGGRLHAQSLRLSPESGEYAMTLFADRIHLARMLEQFGVQEAEGEGTMSGSIPFVISQGRVRFDDAFLYSAPGEGGRIKIAGLGLLASGIPKNSPQYSQLDFAGEALRNFQYNWARLRLITEKDELLLQMQLDGQPAQPIPFKYDSRQGSLSRLEPGESGGIVHPIRLDMNLRLPLEKIMEYGGGIQKLFQQ